MEYLISKAIMHRWKTQFSLNQLDFVCNLVVGLDFIAEYLRVLVPGCLMGAWPCPSAVGPEMAGQIRVLLL